MRHIQYLTALINVVIYKGYRTVGWDCEGIHKNRLHANVCTFSISATLERPHTSEE